MGFLGEKPGFTRRTWAAGAWPDGTFVKGALTTSSLRGVWRPMAAKQVQHLPEGDRSRDPRFFVTRTQLQLAEQGTGLVPDHIQPPGSTDWWEVTGLKDGTVNYTFATPLNHYTYEMLRINEPDG